MSFILGFIIGEIITILALMFINGANKKQRRNKNNE